MERISQFLNFQGCSRSGEKTSTEMRLSKGQIYEKTPFTEDSIYKVKMLLSVKFDTMSSFFPLALMPHPPLSYNRRRPAEEDPV
jgi:hypothetical protein